jgi:hypothetical protein
MQNNFEYEGFPEANIFSGKKESGLNESQKQLYTYFKEGDHRSGKHPNEIASDHPSNGTG